MALHHKIKTAWLYISKKKQHSSVSTGYFKLPSGLFTLSRFNFMWQIFHDIDIFHWCSEALSLLFIVTWHGICYNYKFTFVGLRYSSIPRKYRSGGYRGEGQGLQSRGWPHPHALCVSVWGNTTRQGGPTWVMESDGCMQFFYGLKNSICFVSWILAMQTMLLKASS